MRTCRTSAIFGSAERRLVFDVNDFDETLPGPWEWDVKRLAASLEVAARGNGFPDKNRREIVTTSVARYRKAMRDLRRDDEPEVWYASVDVDELRAQFDSQMKAPAAQDGGQGPGQGADPRQHAGSGQADPPRRRADRRIISDPPLLVPIDELLPRQEDRRRSNRNCSG